MEIDINNIPIPLLMIKQDYLIYFANLACHDLFGYENNALIGQELDILLPPKIRLIHKRKTEEYFKHPVYRRLGVARDLYGEKKGGGIVPIEIGLYPFGEYIMALIIDITTGRSFGVNQFLLKP